MTDLWFLQEGPAWIKVISQLVGPIFISNKLEHSGWLQRIKMSKIVVVFKRQAYLPS